MDNSESSIPTKAKVPQNAVVTQTRNVNKMVAGMFPPSVALFLSHPQIQHKSKVDLAKGRESDLHWTENTDGDEYTVKDLFAKFVDANRKCIWCKELQSALSDLTPLGLLYHECYSVVLLIGSIGETNLLNTIKDCWMRGILRAPKHFRIDKLGEAGCYEMTILERSVPPQSLLNSGSGLSVDLIVSDLVYSCIVDLHEHNLQPTQTHIVQLCRDKQSDLSLNCSDDHILHCLDNLLKQRRLCLSSSQQIYTISNSPSPKLKASERAPKQSQLSQTTQSCSPLSFFNQHAGVIRENSRLFFDVESNEVTGSNTRENKESLEMQSDLSPISCIVANPEYNDKTATKMYSSSEFETSESESPRNCVQAFGKLIAKYSCHSGAHKTKQKRLQTFSAQFPPEEILGSREPNLVADGRSSHSNAIKAESCDVKSSCDHLYLNKDIYAIMKQLQRVQLEGRKIGISSKSAQSRDASPWHFTPIQAGNGEWNHLDLGTIASSSRKNSSVCSPRFVAYLPDDTTGGSDSIVKCPIKTPQWAKDAEFKGSRRGQRNSRIASGVKGQTQHHSRIEYSHHNYFHHQHRSGRRHRRKATLNCSPARITTSDEVYNVVYRGSDRVAAEFAVMSPAKQRTSSRVQVMSSDDSVFSYYRSKYDQRVRKHRRLIRKQRDEDLTRMSALTVEPPSLDQSLKDSHRRSSKDASEKSHSQTSGGHKLPAAVYSNHNANKQDASHDSGITADSSQSPNQLEKMPHSPQKVKGGNTKLC